MKYYKSRDSFVRHNKEHVFEVIPHATDDEAEALLAMFHDMIHTEGEKRRGAEIREVVEYFNEVRDRYRKESGLRKSRGVHPSKTNRDYISARLNDGYAVEDLNLMVEYKFQEWWGSDYQKHLRYQTLFSPSKCSGYVQTAQDWADHQIANAKRGASQKSFKEFLGNEGFAYR